MLEKIRPATPEEVEKIRDHADLTKMSSVLVMGDMSAVWRVANELDPVLFNGAPDGRKYKFLWGLENIFRGAGLSEYYFQAPIADENYLKVLEHLGAERTSKEPEYRYKVTL